MKRFPIWLVTLVLAGTQFGASFGQDGATTTDPTAPINSRFVGKINAAVTGSGQNQTFDFESMLEFREKQAGRLIGYTKAWDQLQGGKLIIDFWAQGRRLNADVELNIPNPNPACEDIILKGVLDASGNVGVPRTEQKLNCKVLFGISITVTTQATVFTRQGEAIWGHWNKIEEHFAPK
jgi:hypothetical protein